MIDASHTDDGDSIESKIDAEFEVYERELREANDVLYQGDEVIVLVDTTLYETGEIADVIGEEYKDVRAVMCSRVEDMRRTLERQTRHLPNLRADSDLLVFETGDGR